MDQTRKKDPIFDFWPLNITLTLELQTLVLRATHRFMKVNISVKVVTKSIEEWKSFGPDTKKTSKCDFDIEMVF